VEFLQAADCRYDAVSLGEVMLRLDPGERRIRSARSFGVWEGGGEYNVVRGLRRCFGLRTSIVTALVDNEIGRLCEDLILTGGVDTSHIRWLPSDGVGRAARNGLNFTERGFGLRAPLGVSDRGHTAVSQLRPGDIDWEDLFGRQRVRWLHTGGIFAALSSTTPDVAEEAMRAAKRHGVCVSYDANYRPSLWLQAGGAEAARSVNRRLMAHVDLLIANESDIFGPEHGGNWLTEGVFPPTVDSFERFTQVVGREWPNVAVTATTVRRVRSATRTDWGAMAWSAGTGVVQAQSRYDIEILDRVGGGDAFAAGLIYGLLQGVELPIALEWGAAHGALTMTTSGDASMVTLDEVKRVTAGSLPGALR